LSKNSDGNKVPTVSTNDRTSNIPITRPAFGGWGIIFTFGLWLKKIGISANFIQGGYGTGHSNTGMVGKLRPMGHTYNLTEPETDTSKNKQNNTSQQGADPGRTYKFLQNRPNPPQLYYNQFLACGGSGMYGQGIESSNRDMSLNNECGMRIPNKSQGEVREMTSSSREGNSYDQNNTSALKKSINKQKIENSGVHTRAFNKDSESFRRGRGEGRRRCSPPQKSKSIR
jgi:hypothetical protein